MGGSSSQSADSRSARKVCCVCSKEESAALLGDDTDIHTPGEDTATQYSVIQFSCSLYYCTEEEGQASIDIVRFGDATGSASVEYRTEDSSAKAGEKYVPTSGVMQFAPHETSKALVVPIIQDDNWDATLEFRVTLKNARGGLLGMYLNHALVKIIDDDAFPTNYYKENFKNGTAEDIPGLGLFTEYFKMNLRSPKIKCSALKLMILDQIHNFYGILLLYLQMYLVDVVLAQTPEEEEEEAEEELAAEGEEHSGRLLYKAVKTVARALSSHKKASLLPQVLIIPGSRMYTAMIVGGIYIMPFLIIHWIDYQKLSLGIAGTSRLHLQTNLLRKFLNYKEEYRANISVGDVTMSMVRDATEVVNDGFMKAFVVLRVIGSLVLGIFFMLSANASALIPCAFLPVFMGIFLCCRSRITSEAGHQLAIRQNETVQTVTQAVTIVRLLADFGLREPMIESYESKVKAFNTAGKFQSEVVLNNGYVPPWLTTCLIGGYMMLAPLQLERFGGTISLGAFLATLNIFKEIGKDLADIYIQTMHIQLSLGPLRRVAVLMNLPTDLLMRMHASRKRRQEGKEKRERSRSSVAEGSGCHPGMVKTDAGEEVFPVDLVNISVNAITFKYPCKSNLIHNVSLTFGQGKLYCFIGPPHQGKATFLRLLGQVLLPSDTMIDGGPDGGSVFVPPHLRILHVSQDTMFWSGTFLYNLVFNTKLKKVGGLERVKMILEALDFPAELMSHVQPPDDNDTVDSDTAFRSWSSILSQSDYPRINLARALIMNPECLILHKPMSHFDESEAKRAIALIRNHVDHRGIGLPEEARKFRRRRTVFFSSSSGDSCLLEADCIYNVSEQDGVQLLPLQRRATCKECGNRRFTSSAKVLQESASSLLPEPSVPAASSPATEPSAPAV